MTEQQFAARLEKAEQTRELDQRKVDGKYEQTLAKLFHSSEWTQQRIADKVGKGQQYVSRLLVLGRFLDYAHGRKTKIHLDTTERAFRKYWEATKKNPKEAKRFQAVLVLMEDDGSAETEVEKESNRKDLVAASKKFLSKKEMATVLGWEPQKVTDTFSGVSSSKNYEVIHNNGTPGHRKYKIVRAGRKISYDQAMKKLDSYLTDLDEQGSVESMAQFSPHAVATAAAAIRKILDDLAK